MQIISRESIESVLPGIDLVAAAERAFIAYSAGQAVVPPVGELLFDEPPGDVHIKYGYLREGETFVIKIASGFYNNPALGLPANNGLMLLFTRRTGELKAILLDEGILTDHRTAAAGACAARALAPSTINRIGVLGTGTQAELQLRYLAGVTPCRNVLVWGRTAASVQRFLERMTDSAFTVQPAASPDLLAEQCELIVTVTAAREPMLSTLPPGRHVTAVGSDTPIKQELDAGLLAQAELVVVDSLAQSEQRGEVYRAVQCGALERAGVRELGQILAGRQPGRTSDQQRTIADLTGVATQDLTVATAVYDSIVSSSKT